MDKISELPKSQNISITKSFLFLFSNFLFGMIVYAFFKVFAFSLDKTNFFILFEAITNFLMAIFLLWLYFFKIKENFYFSISKKDFLIFTKLPLLFSFSYVILSLIFYYFKLPVLGFEIFKIPSYLSEPDNILNKTQLILLANLFFLVPLKEEILIRRFLFVSLRNKFSFLLSAFLSSLVFGILHGNFLLAFSFGFMAAYVYEKYKSLKINVAMHFITNFLIILIALVFRGKG